MFFAYSCKNAAYNFVGCYGLRGNGRACGKAIGQACWEYVPTIVMYTTPQRPARAFASNTLLQNYRRTSCVGKRKGGLLI